MFSSTSCLTTKLSNGWTRSFPVLVVAVRRIYGITDRSNCSLVFRRVPWEVNYSGPEVRHCDADSCACSITTVLRINGPRHVVCLL